MKLQEKKILPSLWLVRDWLKWVCMELLFTVIRKRQKTDASLVLYAM